MNTEFSGGIRMMRNPSFARFQVASLWKLPRKLAIVMQAKVQQHRLEHAQWRVDFARSLLDLHRHTISVGGAEWIKEETILVERLAAAENALQRITADEVS